MQVGKSAAIYQDHLRLNVINVDHCVPGKRARGDEYPPAKAEHPSGGRRMGKEWTLMARELQQHWGLRLKALHAQSENPEQRTLLRDARRALFGPPMRVAGDQP